MAGTTLDELKASDEVRAAVGARNGHGSDRELTMRAVVGARMDGLVGLKGGRTVDPDPMGWGSSGLQTDRRPWGREASTIATIRTIRDIDAQAAHAVWNFLRLVNPGHRLLAISAKADPRNLAPTVSEDDLIEPEGQAVLDDLAKRVGMEYGGGLDQLHNVLALSLITNGAVCSEVAPTDDLTDTEDWYPVDPRLIYFRRGADKRLVMGQKVSGRFSALNPAQVFYQPLDPDVDDPYGRPPLLPAIQSTLSKAQLLNDLRAVAHNQGYPRVDITLNWEEIRKAAPPNLLVTGQESAFRDWAVRQLESIAGDLGKLAVDDMFVHFDWVTISMVGPNYAASTFDFKGLEQILTRSLQASLKTLPILLGINDSTSETHGSIQWQIQVAAVMQLQRLIKRSIERMANASLQLAGVPARAKMRYDEIRAVDRKYEAEAEDTEQRSMAFAVQMGWRSNEEAAQLQVGHAPVAEPIFDPKAQAAVEAAKIGASARKDPAEDKEPDRNTVQKAYLDWRTLLEDDGEDRAAIGHSLRNARLDDEDVLQRYETAGGVFFMQARDDTVELLRAEGWELRDTAKDVADSVFGLSFSRRMKGLLRQAVLEGMGMAGVEDPMAPEALVDRIWESNRRYITKVRDELRASVRAGEFRTLEDVDAWFRARAYRELLMGRFLGKQGITGGYAYARSRLAGVRSFRWVLGVVETKHCEACQVRDGITYTYEELLSVGFPGSDTLDCGAKCHCTVADA